jgi:hypothetical protein
MMKDINAIKKHKDWKKWGIIAAIIAALLLAGLFIWLSWRMMLIKSKKFELRVRIQDFIRDHEMPLADYQFILFDKKGKKVKKRKKKPVVTTIDEETQDLIIPSLYGMQFTLKPVKNHDEYPVFPDLHVKVRRLKDDYFLVKPKRRLAKDLFTHKHVNQVPHFWLNPDHDRITYRTWKKRKMKLRKQLGMKKVPKQKTRQSA